MGRSKLFKIIYEKKPTFCSYCEKHRAKYLVEQVVKGECYTYFLCGYHKDMKVKGFKKKDD